ncbi:MAG: hypothetical protein HY786_03855 [Deltaproteobacteria bacterium]|nr:hypothetical protein [Deltaproteobacteria bacterium]
MFERPRFIENSFSISFNRQLDIRRKSNNIEDMLKSKLAGHYSQPQLIPMPDEFDPQVPRLIFGSTHGYSQIIISQMSISLNVRYSPDYQLDIALGQKYLRERIPVLFEIIESFKEIRPFFCGLTTRVDLYAPAAEDDQIIKHLANLFLKEAEFDKMHDLELKVTRIIDDQFFTNMVIKNFREWRLIEPPQEMLRLSQKKSSIKGIQLIGDFNDRYSFNEKQDYFSGPGVIENIIDKAFTEMNAMIKTCQEAGHEK